MPSDDGTVTGVGVSSIQFYIPHAVSSHEDCPFEADDEFEVATLRGKGLLLTPPEVSPSVQDVLDALDHEADHEVTPNHD